jgi:hypothetical protein
MMLFMIFNQFFKKSVGVFALIFEIICKLDIVLDSQLLFFEAILIIVVLTLVARRLVLRG